MAQEQAGGVGSDVDAEKVVEFLEIRHGEFLFEGVYDVVKGMRGAGCEDYIIDIDQEIGDG